MADTVKLDQHTPGPWAVEDMDHVFAISGVYICAPATPDDFPCLDQDEVSQVDVEAECAANARLIAASPEMFEALIGVVAAWEKFYPLLPVRSDVEDAEFDEFTKARSAICKVLGLQPWDYHKMVAQKAGA